MHRAFPAAALALIVTTAAVAAEPAVPSPELVRALDAVFADYDRIDAPGCALGVIRDGRFIYKRGYGMANLDYRLPLTSRSVFRIGSTSKQFTAFAVLLAAREGKIDLDADVRRYLPALHPYPTPVTVRQLVHHTSGYRDYLTLLSLGGWRSEDWLSIPQAVDLIARQRELNFEPGTQFLYSNSGYFLLSQILEAATGESLRQYAHRRIFAPLGMSVTHFHDDHDEVVSERATGYLPDDEGGYRISVTTLDHVGDGGVFTSVEDLARWDRIFYDPELGFADLLAEALTPGALSDGSSTGYAFGLMRDRYRGLERVRHGGAFVGYRAELARFPDERVSVICLCNRGDASASGLARQVTDLVLAERLEPVEEPPANGDGEEAIAAVEVAPAVLAAYVGGYRRRDEGSIAEIELTDGALTYTSSTGTYPLTPLAEDRFRMGGVPVAIELDLVAPEGGDGRPRIEMTVAGEDELRIYEPVELVTPDAEQLAAYAGDWACPEISTTLRVSVEEGKLRFAHADRFKDSPETLLSPTVADSFAGSRVKVEFEREEGGPPGVLRLAGGRVTNLRCTRE